MCPLTSMWVQYLYIQWPHICRHSRQSPLSPLPKTWLFSLQTPSCPMSIIFLWEIIHASNTRAISPHICYLFPYTAPRVSLGSLVLIQISSEEEEVLTNGRYCVCSGGEDDFNYMDKSRHISTPSHQIHFLLQRVCHSYWMVHQK